MSACHALGVPPLGGSGAALVASGPPKGGTPNGCCNSARRIKTARDDEPESIHTSSVSLDLATASTPFQFAGFTSAHSSAADFSNQMFEPLFSMRSATL